MDLSFLEEASSFALENLILLAEGRYAIAIGRDRRQRLWNLDEGTCLDLTPELRPGVVAVSPSGRFLLAAADRGVRVIDASSGTTVRELPAGRERVEAVAWFPDERFVLVGSETTSMGARFKQSSEISLWDVEAGEQIATLAGHVGSVPLLAVSGNGRFAVSAGQDRTLGFWEFDWECTIPQEAEWDERARPFLQAFLMACRPYALSETETWSPSDPALTLVRTGSPLWTEEQFSNLLRRLQTAGLGWLRPEGVRAELRRMALERSGNRS